MSELWIKDNSVEPKDGWKFYVAATSYTVTANSYRKLFLNIGKHCSANGVQPPPEEEVVQFLCDNVTVDCRKGRDPYPNKFTEANPGDPNNSPIPREQWPLWVKALALLAQPGDGGIGDVVARTIGPSNSTAFKEWHLKALGYACNCSSRQARWNAQYPLAT